MMFKEIYFTLTRKWFTVKYLKVHIMLRSMDTYSYNFEDPFGVLTSSNIQLELDPSSIEIEEMDWAYAHLL